MMGVYFAKHANSNFQKNTGILGNNILKRTIFIHSLMKDLEQHIQSILRFWQNYGRTIVDCAEDARRTNKAIECRFPVHAP